MALVMDGRRLLDGDLTSIDLHTIATFYIFRTKTSSPRQYDWGMKYE